MLENFIDPIPSLQYVKNQADQLKTCTFTALYYAQYSELLISAPTTHYKKFKWDTKFGYKSRRSVYYIEHLNNDGYETSFDI